MKDSDLLSLNSHCTICVGFTRTAIFDFKQKKHFFVSHDWGQLLSHSQNLPLATIHKKMTLLTKKERFSFIQFLIDQEIAFIHTQKRPHKTGNKNPLKKNSSKLKSISISVSQDKPYLTPVTVNKLGLEQAKFIIKAQINLPGFLYPYKKTILESINLEMTYDYASQLNLEELIIAFPCIRRIKIIDSPIDNKLVFKNATISYRNKSYYSTPGYDHKLDYTRFLKSQTTNLFYAGHVHITDKGHVKNTRHTTENFGKLGQYTLDEIIVQPDFQKLWYATKKKIDVCCDCEFSAVCLDKRVLKRRGNDSYYSEEECLYNPYICLSEGEEGYLNLEECGISSKKNGFRIDVDQFIQMKNRFWVYNREFH